MEFPFNINRLFGSEISFVNRNLTPSRNLGGDSLRQAQEEMKEVLDRLGERSAKAQGLYGAITSGQRLQFSDHHLYMLTDSSAAGGKGEAVGFIKVGRKRLFVYDPTGVQQELEPMCVLDFYVHESRQRHGYGRKLFDHMMQREGIEKAEHLAIDRPSHKFISFLKKHYGLSNNVPQLNNFVVFAGFFRSRPASESVIRHRRHQPHASSRATSANIQRREARRTAADLIQQQHSLTSLNMRSGLVLGDGRGAERVGGEDSRRVGGLRLGDGRATPHAQSPTLRHPQSFSRHQTPLFGSNQFSSQPDNSSQPVTNGDSSTQPTTNGDSAHQPTSNGHSDYQPHHTSPRQAPQKHSPRIRAHQNPAHQKSPRTAQKPPIGNTQKPPIGNTDWHKQTYLRQLHADSGWNVLGIPSAHNAKHLPPANKVPQRNNAFSWWN